MQLGAVLAGATEREISALGEYGRYLGMAFQITDDVLDLVASEDVLGKPVASDLREGKVTLAPIHALHRSDSAERDVIEAVVREAGFKSVSHRQVLSILERYGSIDYAHRRAAEFADRACTAIFDFPDTEIKRALLWAPEYVVGRDK
ncbi:MAG: hypothetical protein NVS9B15_04810 [Acidobacteriaceae bacterium]